MITEIGTLDVTPGREAEFEQAWSEVSHHIENARGLISVEILKGIESPSRFLLIARWETIEDHMEGFRGSEVYKAFRGRLGAFYEPSTHMEHFQALA